MILAPGRFGWLFFWNFSVSIIGILHRPITRQRLTPQLHFEKLAVSGKLVIFFCKKIVACDSADNGSLFKLRTWRW